MLRVIVSNWKKNRFLSDYFSAIFSYIYLIDLYLARQAINSRWSSTNKRNNENSARGI